MHNALFDHLQINACYLPYAPEPESFAEAIQGFKAMGLRGANVTIPFKTEFIHKDDSPRLVDELSEISKFTGSVNTLYWKNGIVGGTLCGTTTDPYGCIRNLEENGVRTSDRKVALLGNGGAAKAIAFTLVEQGNKLTIVCRSKEKGQALADSLNGIFFYGIQTSKDHPEVLNPVHEVQISSFDEFKGISANFDIIINATSVGMTPNDDESPLTEDCLHTGQTVCDIVYAPPVTKLLQMAKQKGCTVVTGEGMLVHQGLESFKKWFPAEVVGHTNEELTAVMRKGMQG
jgi:shikimate dehydrogenase